jgi:molecular chaperone DnaJ
MPDKDLYRVLGVQRKATTEQIKKAYRKLARRDHPDFNPGDKQAEERFKELSEAHEILADPEKRKRYDEFGMQGLQAGFDATRARTMRGEPGDWGAEAEFFRRGGFGRYANFEDIVGGIFGTTAGFEARPGADSEAAFEVDLMDAIRGLSPEFSVDHAETCTACGGSGAEKGSQRSCPQCHGRGRLRMGEGPIALERSCPQCRGRGRIDTRPCKDCSGRGHVPRRERLRVHIPAGVDTGSRVRVPGRGGPGQGGGPPGDLYLVIRVRPHRLLERRGNDLYLEVPVTVGEAMLGATINVPTPDGEVRLKVPPASQSGKQLRLRGRGVPRLKGKGRGDLYVRLMVHVPTGGGEQLRKAADAVDAAYAGDVRGELRL